MDEPELMWHCWFCSKAVTALDDSSLLVAGPMNIAICTGCVMTCIDIINERRAKCGGEPVFANDMRERDELRATCARLEAELKAKEQPVLPTMESATPQRRGRSQRRDPGKPTTRDPDSSSSCSFNRPSRARREP